MNREAVFSNPSLRGLYGLCREQPPTSNVKSFRWSVFANDREALSRAYQLGVKDQPGNWPDTSYCAAAWLAGRDAA